MNDCNAVREALVDMLDLAEAHAEALHRYGSDEEAKACWERIERARGFLTKQED